MKNKLMALAAAAFVASAGAASAISVPAGGSLSIQMTGFYTTTDSLDIFNGSVITFVGDPTVAAVNVIDPPLTPPVTDPGDIAPFDTTSLLAGDTLTVDTTVDATFSFRIDPLGENALFTATSTVLGTNTLIPAALNDNVSLEGEGLLNGQSASWRFSISGNGATGGYTLLVITPPEIIIVPPPSAVPLPAGGALLLSGLGALALYRRKKQAA